MSKNHRGANAIHNSAEHFAHGYASESELTRQELAFVERQLRDYKPRY